MCGCEPASQLRPCGLRGSRPDLRLEGMQADPPFVSIVIPVKNEERILARCLESIRNLDYPPDRFEVIVADSMSTDKSRHIAETYGARVVPNGKGTVVAGRNRGFEAARGDFIAFTDADCVVSRGWLAAAVRAFDSDDIAGVGGVTVFPEDATEFQKAVNVLFALAGLAGSTSHLEDGPERREADDLPGCNACYRRSALETVMPVDENLLTAEDVWMNRLLRRHGYSLVFCRDVMLWHHRRSTPWSFCRQMYRFAIGRVQAGRRDAALLRPVHVLAGLGLPLLVAVAAVLHVCKLDIAIAAVLILCCGASVILGMVRTRSVKAAVWVPAVMALFAAAWSAGFLRELLFPMRNVDGK